MLQSAYPQCSGSLNHVFFFFQAEDGIRDLTVTGVQTCALPILVNTPPILAATRAVVLRGMEQLRKTAKVRQELLHYLDSPNPSTVLVLVHETPEPPDAELLRRATAVEVAALPPERVVRWMTHRAKQLGFTLAPEAEELLLASVRREGETQLL